MHDKQTAKNEADVTGKLNSEKVSLPAMTWYSTTEYMFGSSTCSPYGTVPVLPWYSATEHMFMVFYHRAYFSDLLSMVFPTTYVHYSICCFRPPESKKSSTLIGLQRVRMSSFWGCLVINFFASEAYITRFYIQPGLEVGSPLWVHSYPTSQGFVSNLVLRLAVLCEYIVILHHKVLYPTWSWGWQSSVST